MLSPTTKPVEEVGIPAAENSDAGAGAARTDSTFQNDSTTVHSTTFVDSENQLEQGNSELESLDLSDSSVNQIQVNLELDAIVDEAEAMMQSGQGPPMQPILLLKDVLTVDQNHERALERLGFYSMQSGQWNKAVDRYHHLTQIRPEVEMYWLNKSRSLLQMGDTTAALTTAQEYLNTYPEATEIALLVAGLQN